MSSSAHDRRTPLDPAIEHFVERMGLLWENDGLPRIAGRIFGLLLVTPDACSLDDLAETLGVSKASISTDARRLEQFGLLQRTTRPGDRRDYYSISDDVFARSLENSMERLRRFQQLMHEARHLPIRSPDVRARFDDMDQAYEVAIGSMTDALARWSRTRTATAARRR